MIYDFDRAEGDKIEFQVTGVDSFDGLVIEMDGDDTVISFIDAASDADDTVTLFNYENTANLGPGSHRALSFTPETLGCSIERSIASALV